MRNQPVVLTYTGFDRALVTAGPAVLGLVLAAVLPMVARWALDLDIPLPFRPVWVVAGSIDRWWELAVQAAILAGLGAVVTMEILRRTASVTVGSDEVSLELADDRRTLPRADIEAIYRDGDALVVLDRESRQAFRGEARAGAAVLERAFREFGYPWRDADPFAELYHRWVPDTGLLPVAADAVLSARAVALRKKAGKEAGELRDTLQKLGYAVRDDGDKQFWRPLVRS
ncbi:YqeB family protein [Actinoplanes aureus]|uniref:Uncharacterized protein n=1 Tax=Actinoplanes aureus TaxID=2792083 RepID=A0A931C636_9ACTN|nr:hypothetical protein [Actinoplanes aureus]MBG0562894.1 hypothetical protein [Actinoplanes aureus]